MSNIFESYNIITEPNTIIIGPHLGEKGYSLEKGQDISWEEKIAELKSQYELLTQQVNNLEYQKENKKKEIEQENAILKNKILQEAETIKENIINQAKQEALKLKEEFKKQGFEEGVRTGTIKINQEMSVKFNLLNQVIKNLEQEKSELLLKYENDIVQLVIDVAKKIIKQEIKTDKEIIISNVKSIIGKISECKLLKIFVNPADIDVLNEYKNNFKNNLPNLKKIEILADENIGVGGCKIETEFGSFDATIKTQIQELEEELKENIIK